MKWEISGKKAKRMLVSLVAMSLSGWGGALAANYTAPMTGNSETDTAYADVVSVDKSNNTTYTFTEDNTITVSGGTPLEFTSSLSGETFKATTAMTTINSTAGSYMYVKSADNNLTLNVTAEGDAIGVGILQTTTKPVINLQPGPKTEIHVTGAEGNTQKSYGIWRAVTDKTSKTVNLYNSTGDTSQISITIDNANGGYGVAISRPDDFNVPDANKKTFSNTSLLRLGFTTNPVAVDIKVSENKNATNVLEESAGIYNNAGSSTLSINGTIDLDVEGNGIVLTGLDESSNMPSVTISNGGKIKVRPDKDGSERYAIYNAKGKLTYGAVRDGTQIDGDLYVANETETTLGLYGSNSYLSGAIKVEGTPKTLGLALTNGGTWRNAAINTANLGVDTKVTTMSGSGGLLYQTKDSGNVTIGTLNSGLFSIAYDHDAMDPTKILGGDVTITAASKSNSNRINVFTDYDDNMSTEAIRKNVLNALAQKIYYTNYTTGERYLTGQVSIAEGLTMASVTKYFADMSFDETTGQGYLSKDTEIKAPTVSGKQTQTEFSTMLSTNIAYIKAYENAGIYKNGVFNFTEDTKFTFDNSLPITTGGSYLTSSIKTGIACENATDSVVIDMNGHDLDISQTTGNVQSAIMSIGSKGLVEINNPGKININVTSSGQTMTAGLFAIWGGRLFIHNGGENQDQKVVTIRGSSNNSSNCALVKTLNEKADTISWIKIDGLVDVEGDTTDGVGAAEGLSAVASTIEVGGGKIIMTASGENPGVNYGGGAANTAIRAYGEFNSTNTGIVNVNVIKDEDTATGTAIAAGNNPVQISGNFSTAGGMGTKGTICVGLNTEDSYWVGNYNYGSGWGVTPGDYGVLKLFMGNKAKWYGYSKFATKLIMDSGAEWTGYSLKQSSQYGAVDATIKNGAVWHNYNDSTKETDVTILKSLTGGDSASSAGYIDMTRAEKETTIQNYAGYMKVMYAHDEADPTSISGANIIINKAEAGSDITLLTDNSGFDVKDTDKTVSVLSNLAKKLIYKGVIPTNDIDSEPENNLSGHVGIAEGLTSSSATVKLADIDFSAENGEGTYVVDSLRNYSEKVGGDSADQAATIDMTTSELPTEVQTVSGYTNVFYAHDEKDPTNISGEDLTIDSAAENSTITVLTDNTGFDVKDTDKTASVLSNLAKKLYYKGAIGSAENNLTGYVGIAEGLTSSSALMKVGDMKFSDETGQGSYVVGSLRNYAKEITGGDSADKAATIDMTASELPTQVQTLSGYADVFYAHDEKDPTNISGGDLIIESAKEKSVVNVITDNTGFDVHDTDKTVGVLSNLAKKIYYKGAIGGAENHLTGYLGIAEGLTSSSALLKVGDMNFSETTGQGSYTVGSLRSPSADIVYGSSETAMMKGAKTAMAGAALLWRAENNDLMKRMGDLRMGEGETGVWAKYYGGKNTFDKQNTDLSVRYNAVQVGFDREVGKNWKLGLAISHNTGSASLGNGSADIKSTGIGLYGTWQHENGSYVDIILKASKLNNEYDVYNTYGHKLHGDYGVWGTSLGIEYGKRFTYANGLTVDPNIEFTFGSVAGKNYDATSDYKTSDGAGKALHVDQDSYKSFIGRLGVRVGKKTQRTSYFAKLALAHEFSGGFDSTFRADGEPTGKTHLDFAGTWLEVQLGVTTKLSEKSYFYADVEKTFGGDVKETWRLDAGFRLSF